MSDTDPTTQASAGDDATQAGGDGASTEVSDSEPTEAEISRGEMGQLGGYICYGCFETANGLFDTSYYYMVSGIGVIVWVAYIMPLLRKFVNLFS